MDDNPNLFISIILLLDNFKVMIFNKTIFEKFNYLILFIILSNKSNYILIN